MKTVVVVPTYNEAENIPILLPRILRQSPAIEVLVVDDNSPDGTGWIIDQLAAVEPRIHVLHRAKKQGLGASYVAGFQWALDYGAEQIVQMDADFSHDPDHLGTFLTAIDDADLVIGSRYIEGGSTRNWSFMRKLISRTGSLYTRSILGMELKDITGGFKCFRRQVLQTIDLSNISAKGYAFQIELTYRALQAGFRVKEIPITFVDRVFGQSKMTGGIALEAMVLLWKLRFGRSATTASHPESLSANATALTLTEDRLLVANHESDTHYKILMVVAEAPPITSGVGKVIGELKDGLENKGHQVDILSSLDIPRYSFGEIRLSTFIFHWAKLRHTLDQYDVINIHAPAPTFADMFLLLASQFGRSKRRQRMVLTYHSEIDLPGLVLQPLTHFYSWLHKRLAPFASHTIVTTPSYASMFEGIIAQDQLSIIPWGADGSAFNATAIDKSSEEFRIAFVGQLRPYKGLDVLLNAVKDLPDVQLSVVGSGHHAEYYQQMAEELQLTNTTFFGRASDSMLQNVLKQAHALVLPSRTKAEAFGIVLIEAMAAGCVPIASDLPGVRDVVAEVGFTFPVGDSVELMKLLAQLRNNPTIVQKYAKAAQNNARYYTWQRCIDAHDRLFRKIAAQRDTKPVHTILPPAILVATEARRNPFASHLPQ